MGTQVRDAIIAAAVKGDGKYYTAEELAEKFKLNVGSTDGTMRLLASKKILTRRRRNGSRLYEYAAGQRIAFGEKYAGRKFPFHRSAREEEANGEAIPAVSGGVGIVVKLDGTAHAITLSEAKKLYVDLKALFG